MLDDPETTQAPTHAPSHARAAMMGLLARAKPETLAAISAGLMPETVTWLRRPETGLVMLRGRIGGEGGAFNLGEMTVTRCALRLESGAVGHATVQGRDKDHARRAAILDALWQGEDREKVETAVLAPLRAAETARNATRAAKAAATRVEFFTLVRGEDQ